MSTSRNCCRRLQLALFPLLTAGELLALLALSGCVSSPWIGELAEPADSGVAVYFESKRDEAAQPVTLGYAHPLNLSASDLSGFLQALRFSSESTFGDRTETELFSTEEAERIAPPMARALSRVGPDQRVRFVSMRATRHYTLFEIIDCTSAVVFAAEPDKIHVAFDYIHEELDEELTEPDPEKAQLHREPTDSLDDQYTIVAPADIPHHISQGREYPRWITATPERVQAVAAAVIALSAEAPVDGSQVVPPVPVSTKSTPFAGASADGPKTVIADFHGYAIVRVGDLFYGLPKSSSSSGTSGEGVLKGESAGAVIDAILAAERANE